MCLWCRMECPLGKKCETLWCEVFGHKTSSCTATCRRCVGNHITADCYLPRSYATTAACQDTPANNETEDIELKLATPTREQLKLSDPPVTSTNEPLQGEPQSSPEPSYTLEDEGFLLLLPSAMHTSATEADTGGTTTTSTDDDANRTLQQTLQQTLTVDSAADTDGLSASDPDVELQSSMKQWPSLQLQ
ncbi:hypothetical protein HPB50_003970 [Hyalomma asiaticum]|uniref:Uncharacterized protein n=1 Tax=Hyalomma asiaticum TaxID=266040 RepID=A0ACB7T5T3_HYAAI|nr:hypothetical protein HPB50_003970 [Hyalomma asiaticum]